MKKIDHGIVSVTILCIFLGTIIGIQFKTVKKQATAYDIQRVSELSIKLNSATSENESLLERIKEKDKKIAEYESYMAEESKEVKTILDESSNLKMLAGLTAVSGRGISVAINDSPKAGQQNEGISTDAFLVHAEDILSILNELNVAGAEAVCINGQRIISTSAVRCAGSVVNINDVKIAAPFVITAIGDPDILEASLMFPGGVVDALKPWGIEIIIKKMELVEIPAFEQQFEFKEAKPSKAEGL
ncbi:MAG: DUF881 domain-containing protein [Lachnospiraceae bacterium]|nr:DUF881 domain-containing protein [Lachnospiraceae bacterium]